MRRSEAFRNRQEQAEPDSLRRTVVGQRRREFPGVPVTRNSDEPVYAMRLYALLSARFMAAELSRVNRRRRISSARLYCARASRIRSRDQWSSDASRASPR